MYYLAPPTSSDGRYGLVRAFVLGQLPAAATLAQKADAALAAAMTVPADNPNRFVAAWPAGTTARYVALPAPEVGVSLSGPGVTGLPEQAQRLAVQALVWTVTAAVQQATAPVAVTVASGGPIFETVGTNIFKRPGAAQQFEELATIWVDSPYADQVLAAGKAVVVTGQACVFEANVTWELRQGGSVVKQGHTTADVRVPSAGFVDGRPGDARRWSVRVPGDRGQHEGRQHRLPEHRPVHGRLTVTASGRPRRGGRADRERGRSGGRRAQDLRAQPDRSRLCGRPRCPNPTARGDGRRGDGAVQPRVLPDDLAHAHSGR